MRRSLAALVVCAVAGCGGEDGGEVLRATSDRLGEVRSARLDLRVLATPADRRRGVGFELSGPFAFGGETPLPVTRMRYSRVLGDRRVTGTLTSTGTRAFLTFEGRTTELDEAGSRRLRLPSGRGEGRTLAALGLDIERWLEDAEVEDGPRLDGTATDRVTGTLRTGIAVRDVLRTLRRAGAQVPEPTDGLARRIDGLVRTSRIEVVAGREDRLLRRLELRADLRPSEELDAAVPGSGAIRLTARLELRALNEPVEVAAPG